MLLAKHAAALSRAAQIRHIRAHGARAVRAMAGANLKERSRAPQQAQEGKVGWGTVAEGTDADRRATDG